ncbi:hypothetical protein EV421DRAFT_1063077 [Armillaria borealis]|uniref:Peptidase A1 domain-containing protein n=1 Tax=Armillaria borealis TaxID=47425 RepID=A0AA39MYX4_9AGAR|nr:hypothetical protein EV421DRAFT_1063077 [Armillaria borealis]
MAIARRHCSSFFTLSFISGFIVVAVSSLAPSALSVDSILVDGHVLAFSVGAVPANSALNVSDMDAFTFQMPAENVRGNTQEAAAIAWAENALGSQYMFRVPSNGTSYIIPVPENLPTTTSARWLTDVVALNPSCAWQETNISSTLQIGSNTTSNSTSSLSNDVYVNIPAISADIKLPWSSISLYEVGIMPIDTFDILNSTSHDPASNGVSVWVIAYPTNTSLQRAPVVEFDFTNKPTFTIAVDSNVYQVGIMACSPNPTIETREVLNDGSGNLSIEPRIPRYSQGNLHPFQTAFLLSFALSDLHDSAGPTITFEGFGTELEAQLFFGFDQVKAFNITLDSFTFTPVSDQEITGMYTRLLQSASKVFVSGNLGSVYVPGRTATETAVFTSSLPVISGIHGPIRSPLGLCHRCPLQGGKRGVFHVVFCCGCPGRVTSISPVRSAQE